MNDNVFKTGPYGTAAWFQKVVRPFLDTATLDGLLYHEKVRILGTFCQELAIAIDERFPKVMSIA